MAKSLRKKVKVGILPSSNTFWERPVKKTTLYNQNPDPPDLFVHDPASGDPNKKEKKEKRRKKGKKKKKRKKEEKRKKRKKRKKVVILMTTMIRRL